jgi:acyl-CoA reductase-like NAD-dependent aldehyde dehydrogenase
VRHPDVAKISFTGSVAVGESIMRDGAATDLDRRSSQDRSTAQRR